MTESAAYGLVAGIFVGFAAGYVGSLMVLKRMALVGDALSHVALPGLALGILFNFNPFLGAFAFLFAGAILTWYIERTTRLFPESIVGVLFVTALAVGILITHDIHIVSQYSDAVLALNRTVRFFGASSRLSEPDLLMEIFGSGSGLAEHKHDFGTRGFR